MVAVAEITIIVAVVGWFLVPNITTIMEVARSYASCKCKQLKWAKKNLLKLATDLEAIKGILKPVCMGFVNDQTWLDSLWRFKEAIHDAEEILDLFESHMFEEEEAKKLKKHRGGASSSRKSTAFSRTSSSKLPSLDQLEKVLQIVGELLIRAPELQFNCVQSPIRDDMGQDPARDRNLFFGYINEYEQLITMLRDSNTDKKVIAILGHGGMGKTELARQAFREVKSEFNLLIWVPAYGKNTQFDLLAEIWKSAVGKNSICKMNIPGLQNELKELLKSKKCLLVLDDVWSVEQAISESPRKNALRCFTDYVSAGSRIVMTTRAKICSVTLSADATITLNGIGDPEVSRLLNETANLVGETGDSPIRQLLSKQLPKLKGSPLAAVEIGEELSKQGKSFRRCSNILNDVENHMGSVFSAHLFTYQHLPPHLQRCLAFCSIFPSSWRFKAEKLIRMWIANGFIEEEDTRNPASGKKSMEDTARGYFDSLVDLSLFQKEAKGKGGKQTYYVIHEHIHWMIRRVSSENCVSISAETGHSAGPSKRSIPATVRHLSVTSGCLDQLNAYTTRLSNLRTLLVLRDGDGNDPVSPTPLISSIDKDILKLFKGVRVLDLSETGITQLPENIGKLKHVRYLGLPSTIGSNLSDQVSRLWFLQTLTVGDKRKNEEFVANISSIGRLVRLRESIEFHVMRESEKEGHSLSELAGMNSLRGTLSIKGLDAVTSMKEAEEACLANKVDIIVLKLEWEPQAPVDPTGGPAAANLALAVLNGLKPPSNLKVLRITRYHGATSPKWLSGLNTLTHLYLRNCRNLQALPAVGGLPCLELLNIKELNSVSKIGSNFCGGGVFPKLKQIVLEDMPKLVAWDRMPENALHKLTKVRIVDCPCLSSLSGLEYRVGLHLRIERCTSITQVNLPSNFSNGGSTCRFE